MNRKYEEHSRQETDTLTPTAGTVFTRLYKIIYMAVHTNVYRAGLIWGVGAEPDLLRSPGE